MSKEVDDLLLARERTHLAEERSRLSYERTFLSWIRTGLALVGGGVLIVRLLPRENFSNQHIVEIIGFLLILLGLGIFLLATLDYRHSFQKLKVSAGYAGSLTVIYCITLLLAAISVALLFIVFYIEQ